MNEAVPISQTLDQATNIVLNLVFLKLLVYGSKERFMSKRRKVRCYGPNCGCPLWPNHASGGTLADNRKPLLNSSDCFEEFEPPQCVPIVPNKD